MNRRKLRRKIRQYLKLIILASIIVLMIVMLVSKKSGSLIISLDNAAMNRGISLSEEIHQTKKTAHLKATPLHDAWNISGDSIPENITQGDGSKNGDYYLAYSFYLINSGEESVNLTFQIKVKSTKSLDETIRIRLYYQDDTPITYAKKASDGYPEPGTKEFQDDNSIIDLIGSLGVEEMIKVTIVMWVEGDDPDTTDDKIGGSVSLDAIIKIME